MTDGERLYGRGYGKQAYGVENHSGHSPVRNRYFQFEHVFLFVVSGQKESYPEQDVRPARTFLETSSLDFDLDIDKVELEPVGSRLDGAIVVPDEPKSSSVQQVRDAGQPTGLREPYLAHDIRDHGRIADGWRVLVVTVLVHPRRMIGKDRPEELGPSVVLGEATQLE